MKLVFALGLRTSRGGNNREHPMARHRRVQEERRQTALAFLATRCGAQWAGRPPYVVHLVRLKPSGKPLDDDNLRMSLKAVRDEVAGRLKVDDGNTEAIRFTYAQERGPWGVRVEVTATAKPTQHQPKEWP